MSDWPGVRHLPVPPVPRGGTPASLESPGNVEVNVCRDEAWPALISLTSMAIELESIPPLNAQPTGTSLRRWMRTLSRSLAANNLPNLQNNWAISALNFASRDVFVE